MSCMSNEYPALARRSDLDALRAGAMLLGISPARFSLVFPVTLGRHGSSAGSGFRDRLLGHPWIPDAAVFRHERFL